MFSRARTVVPYMGLSNGHRVFAKGRVFVGRAIINKSSGRLFRNLWDSVKRFRTLEYPGIQITLTLGGNQYTTHTDHEGYYTFDFLMPEPMVLDHIEGDVLNFFLKISEEGYDDTTVTAALQIVRDSSTHVIVTDVDDTVMESYVSSAFKIKMLYNAFTKAPFQRKPVKGMVHLLQSAHRGDFSTPIIYLSNSPWNFYDFIMSFLDHHDFPLGPVFLRDYGRQMITKKKTDPIHKMEMLHLFLSLFKNQKFVLFGDSAECDIDYYTSIAKEYPKRVSAIFIRDIGHVSNKSRIESIANESQIPVYIDEDPRQFQIKVDSILDRV